MRDGECELSSCRRAEHRAHIDRSGFEYASRRSKNLQIEHIRNERTHEIEWGTEEPEERRKEHRKDLFRGGCKKKGQERSTVDV